MNILSKLASLVIAAAMSFGVVSPVSAPQQLGAAVPTTPALYDSYLASGISKTDTTLTLSTGTLRNGSILSGFVCFTIDVNLPTVEYVCGTASSTAVTGLTRGVDVSNPNATSSALAYAHRRFASIAISDYPTIQFMVRKLNGTEGFDSPIKYSSSVSTTTISSDSNNLASVGYANSLSFGSVPPASETASGFVELATGVETASSTLTGSTGARLALSTAVSTSTWYSAAASSNKIPVSNSSGVLAAGWIASSTDFSVSSTLKVSATTTLATSTTIGQTNAFDIGKHLTIITATTTVTTFVPPTFVSIIDVQCVGAGGGGGGNSSGAGGGAGAGGYFRKIINISASTSIAVTIGTGGAGGAAGGANNGTTGGTTIFGGFASSTGGFGGSGSSGGGGGGNYGGNGLGGDINIYGGAGTDGITTLKGGAGGASFFGGNSGSAVIGYENAAYGAGGAAGTGNQAGMRGKDGVCIIQY